MILADEVYGDLGHDGRGASRQSSIRMPPVISFSSLSKAFLAPGWRTGWMGIGRTPRLDDVTAAIGKLADGRLCSTVPMQYAVAAALCGDRSHQISFRAALKERAAMTTASFQAIPGVSCVAPAAGFYAMPRVTLPPGRTDEDYVLALLRATGVLCVTARDSACPPPTDSCARLSRLAAELRDIYAPGVGFTRDTSTVSEREFTHRMLQTVFTITGNVIIGGSDVGGAPALMLIYVSALIAMGFSPMVSFADRPRRLTVRSPPGSVERSPSWPSMSRSSRCSWSWP